MAEFTPINTQEELDKLIGERLASKENKIRAEYADYEDLKKQVAGWNDEKAAFEKTIADNKTAFDELTQKYDDATGKIAQYEADALKTKVAIESGIPAGLFKYLQGATEEEIRKSAEELGKFTKGATAPLADPEGESLKNDFETTGKIDEERVRKKFIDSFKILDE